MAGGQLFGFLGVLLALPTAAVTMVLLRYLHERYQSSHMYGAEPEPVGVIVLPASAEIDLPAPPASADESPRA
jgi:hypothetical protein